MPLPPLPPDLACPDPTPDLAVQVEVVNTGFVHDDWKRVVDDGTSGDVAMALLVGVIRTPDATVLVDSGLGATTLDGSYPRFPISALSEVEVTTPVAQLLDAPPDLVLLTHPHYDHVGGLFDLPDVPVWITEDDWQAYGGGAIGFPRRLKEAVDWHPVALRDGETRRVMGRPAVDVLGDGRIWYLSLPGHTPGAAAVLVRAEDGPWLFVGDTAWVDRHLEDAGRPWFVKALLDFDAHENAESLAWARHLAATCPDLRIVTGHEPSLADGRSSRAPSPAGAEAP